MFYLIIFKDITQKTALCVLKYKRMKHLIKATNGEITYNTIRQKEASDKKYVTRQSHYRVIKC